MDTAAAAAKAAASAAFDRLYGIVRRLRDPNGGCPWDLKQNPASLRGDLIEETYECVEAINEGEPGHIREELGDVFLLATMISYMNEQAGAFSVADALDDVSAKLVRRHPHVFGDSSASTAEQVLEQWAKIKVEQEGRRPKDSLLDGVSRALPPLERAYKLQKAAAKVGFDWPEVDQVWAKINEELAEAKAAYDDAVADPSPRAKAELEGELGDLLFAVVNVCRYLKVDPAVALHSTNVRFADRFGHVERGMKAAGRPMEAGRLAEMDRLWDEAKRKEKAARP
jgi:tetrapyrrole methylase family protein/MazG family protein